METHFCHGGTLWDVLKIWCGNFQNFDFRSKIALYVVQKWPKWVFWTTHNAFSDPKKKTKLQQKTHQCCNIDNRWQEQHPHQNYHYQCQNQMHYCLCHNLVVHNMFLEVRRNGISVDIVWIDNTQHTPNSLLFNLEKGILSAKHWYRKIFNSINIILKMLIILIIQLVTFDVNPFFTNITI